MTDRRVVDRYLNSLVHADDLVQLDQPAEVFRPLPPADDAVAGVVDIEERLRIAKRVAVYLPTTRPSGRRR